MTSELAALDELRRFKVKPSGPRRTVTRTEEGVLRPTGSPVYRLTLSCGHKVIWRRQGSKQPPQSAVCTKCEKQPNGERRHGE